MRTYKRCFRQITKSLSLDLAPKIRVNAVCAGTIKTPMA
ncbi:SDR family oxidoreductase [Campylobacter coli]|nr:SDR family oxidoreductase [Campylobacter coli]MBT0874852.1 SDR family oxidoreductase [Campylobacter coli]